MAIISCKECKKEVSNTAATCPHCGAAVKRKPMGCGTLITFILFVAVAVPVFTSISSNISKDPATSAVGPTPAPTKQPLACDKPSAQKLQGMIQALSKTTREGGSTKIQWGNDFNSWSKETKLKMTEAAANADACLTGAANQIMFYSPAGALSAVALPTTGIRLVD